MAGWQIPQWMRTEIWSNEIVDWSVVVLLVLLLVVAMQGVKRFVLSRIGKQEDGDSSNWSKTLKETLGRTSLLLFVVLAVGVVSKILFLPSGVEEVLGQLSVLAIILQFGLWADYFATVAIRRWFKADNGAEQPTAGATIVRILARVFVWSGILILILDNLGVNVLTLIAGLGVGGVAIGLATQSIFSDLFASFSIILDKPFAVGDFVILNDMMGTVERIGLKSTRIRSLSGEQLVFSNNDMLQSRIRNYKNIQIRRNVIAVGVEYSTSAEKLRMIPGIVESIINGLEKTTFDRAHFRSFGDFSLVFEFVYFVHDPEYRYFMDIQEKFNLALCDRFREEGIEFAFPTQTLHLFGRETKSREHMSGELADSGM